ncbi:MAG: site-2 protease family protein [Planctomycetes bacterium]|nr:site-2 protease family protein [Planctomycetota bacterium]
MCNGLIIAQGLTLAAIDFTGWLLSAWALFQIILGFSVIIFVHELGHFGLAKWANVRVEKFCIGFGRELFGFTRGETRYGFNILPLGGYVKMLGQEDFEVDESGEMRVKDDPRSFPNKPIGHRMLIVSGGVVMNVIFAALLFTAVFMIGKEVGVTEIGFVLPDSPADVAGLLVGDTIREIDGQKINDFTEISMAIMLADPHKTLDFHIERGGESIHLNVLPINSESANALQVGISPAMTALIVAVGSDFDDQQDNQPHAGDTVILVDGQEVNDANANQMMYRILHEFSRDHTVTVERREDPENPDSPVHRHQVNFTPRPRLAPSDRNDPDSGNLLGLRPLVQFAGVVEDSPAQRAGIRPDDLVLLWEDTPFPTGTQIRESIARNPDKVIAIRVRHGDGEEEDLWVRPAAKRHLLGADDPPQIGALYGTMADEVLLIGNVIETVHGRPTAAAQAGIPAGALILEVDGHSVGRWHELVDRFIQAAGTTVPMAYRDPDGSVKTVDFHIPPSLRTVLGLPVSSYIWAINGKSTVTVEIDSRRTPAWVNRPHALHQVLRENVGRTIELTYMESAFSAKQKTELEVTEDMIDPWMGRIAYDANPSVGLAQATKLLQTSNPIVAMGIGIKKTEYFILNVYTTIRRMVFSRSVGVENMAGPLGIIKIGSDVAKRGFADLLYLLAILSANLAVINFLPLPIVDGGLMVFLIIEKIKGAPVSVKTQMVTQVIGLALIALAFVFVTYQDVLRITGGS